MEYLTHLLRSTSNNVLANSTTLDLVLQVTALLIAIVISLYAHRHWNHVVDSRIADSDRPMPTLIALRGTKRLSFSLNFAVFILLFYSLFKLFGYPVGLFYLAWPLVFTLAFIRVTVFLLRVAAASDTGNRKIEQFVSINLWVIFVLYLLGWLPVATELLNDIALDLGGIRISLLGVIKFFTVFSILVLVSLAISRNMEARLLRTDSLDSGLRLGLVKVLRYGLVGIAVLIALGISGFDLTALTVMGGALSIGIGFGLQKITSNLVSGFLLLFDRSIRSGDVISIGESYGVVKKMSGRYIVVRDRNGVDTLIPNEELISTRVINWSYGDHNVRLKLPVQISYGDNPRLAMKLLKEAAEVNERVIDDPAPMVRLMGFGDDGINLELRVWIGDPEKGVNNVLSDINLAIWDAFYEHDITFPYPQRDVHLTQTKQD